MSNSSLAEHNSIRQLTHQRQEHDGEQWCGHYRSQKDALWVKVVLPGEAAPVLPCQAVDRLQKVYCATCLLERDHQLASFLRLTAGALWKAVIEAQHCSRGLALCCQLCTDNAVQALLWLSQRDWPLGYEELSS